MHCNQPTSYRGLDYYESMNDQIRRLIESMTSNKRHVPITPWSSQQEWNFVAETLWSRQINHIRMGIRVCETWMIRSLSIPIPPAVESTLAIFKIVLLCNDSVIHKFFEINRSSAHDHKSHLSTGPLSETYTDDDNDAISGYEEMINEKNSCKYCNESKNFVVDEGTIRLALSAAIIRFVNESVDPLQQGMFAVPITGLADRLGIPRSVVDIRHEATHDVLPSLESLLNASRLSLEWLKTNYWLPQQNWCEEAKSACDRVIHSFSSATSKENSKDITQMLSKPVEKMIEPFLVDLPHVEFSPYIQSILLSHIMLSTEYSIDFLSLIPEALIIANEELFIQTLLNYTCSCPDAQTFESERFKTVFIRCIARLKSVRSLELAAKICILHANRKVWDTLVLEHKPSNLNLSDQLNRIIDENLLPRKQKIPCLSNRINSKNHLNSQDFLHVIESNGLNLEPNKNSDGKEEDDAGWSEVKNWTPLPLGCTHTFNLLTQFHLLYQNFET